MTRERDNSCIICGDSLLKQKCNRSARRRSFLDHEKQLGHWKRDCSQSLIEILFESETHCLQNYFEETDKFCPSCLQKVRDVDFNLRKIKSLTKQLDILSKDIRKNIVFNYNTLKEKSKDEDAQTRLSELRKDKNGISNYRYEQILEMIYSDMLVCGQSVFEVTPKIGKEILRHSEFPPDELSVSGISDEDEGDAGDGDMDVVTSPANIKFVESTCEGDIVCEEPAYVVVDFQDCIMSGEVIGDKSDHNKSKNNENVSSVVYELDVSDIQENPVLLELVQKEDTSHDSQEVLSSVSKNEDNNFDENDSDCVDTCVSGSNLSSSIENKEDPSKMDGFQNALEKSVAKIPKVDIIVTYKCKFCFKEFKCQQDLDSHISTSHKEKDPYTCVFCKIICSNSIVLSLHTKTCRSSNSTPKKLYRCEFCGKRDLFTTFEDLQIHKGNVHNFKCTLCSEVLHSKSKLSKHLKKIHDTGYLALKKEELKAGKSEVPINLETLERSENPHFCKTCGKSFKTLRILIDHEKVHTGEKAYECDMCGKGFVKLYDLNKHVSVHTGEGPYKCFSCGVTFSTAEESRSHERSHTGKKEYECETCGKRFGLQSALKKHESLHTGDMTKSTCQLCGKVLKSIYLKKHLKRHEAEENHPCDICGRQFLTLKTLNNHLKIHNNESTTFACETCGRMYLTLEVLKKHENCHIGVRHYKCDVCDKTFATSKAKKTHEKCHFKPYQCDTCGKRFSQVGNLKNHIRTHTGVKPFECPFCDKRFTERGSCKDHIRIHTGYKPYSCKICGKSFSQQRSLRRHSQTHTASTE